MTPKKSVAITSTKRLLPPTGGTQSHRLTIATKHTLAFCPGFNSGVFDDNGHSLMKSHCLHKGYVQMPVQKVHKWIYQSAVACTSGYTRYIHSMSWVIYISSVAMDSLVLEHRRSSCYRKSSSSEVCRQWLIQKPNVDHSPNKTHNYLLPW